MLNANAKSIFIEIIHFFCITFFSTETSALGERTDGSPGLFLEVRCGLFCFFLRYRMDGWRDGRPGKIYHKDWILAPNYRLS